MSLSQIDRIMKMNLEEQYLDILRQYAKLIISDQYYLEMSEEDRLTFASGHMLSNVFDKSPKKICDAVFESLESCNLHDIAAQLHVAVYGEL